MNTEPTNEWTPPKFWPLLICLALLPGCLLGDNNLPFHRSFSLLAMHLGGEWGNDGVLPTDPRGDLYALAGLCQEDFHPGGRRRLYLYECPPDGGPVRSTRIRYLNVDVPIYGPEANAVALVVGSERDNTQTYVLDSNMRTLSLGGARGLGCSAQVLGTQIAELERTYKIEVVGTLPEFIKEMVLKSYEERNLPSPCDE